MESQKKQITEIKKELEKQSAIDETQEKLKTQLGTALIAAFGFLIALVWKDAITNYTSHIVSFLNFPSPEAFQVLYIAIITSFISVLGIVFVNLWMPKQADLLKSNPLT